MRFFPVARRPLGRWAMLWTLFGMAFCAYIQRTGIAIAADQMTPELGLTQTDLGWLLTAFLASYTALQVPSGQVGERIGAHATLCWASLMALAGTALTVVFPSLFTGGLLIAALILARALVGAAQAPVFPISSGVLELRFPRSQWSFGQGVLTTGMHLGAALTPPMVAYLMTAGGWRMSLLVTTLPFLLLAIFWLVYAQDPPEMKARAAESPPRPRAPGRGPIRRLLLDRDLMALSASYLSMNYVFYLLTFWCFLYFVQARGFSAITSGWFAAAPFVGAGVGATVGGKLTDVLRRRVGDRWGFRLVPLVALPMSALALYAALRADSAVAADLALCVAFATIELNEGAYWAGAMRISGSDSMIATGILNTAGNVGGIIGTPIVAAFSAQHGWTGAFLTGSACAILAMLLWFFVDASRRSEVTP